MCRDPCCVDSSGASNLDDLDDDDELMRRKMRSRPVKIVRINLVASNGCSNRLTYMLSSCALRPTSPCAPFRLTTSIASPRLCSSGGLNTSAMRSTRVHTRMLAGIPSGIPPPSFSSSSLVTFAYCSASCRAARVFLRRIACSSAAKAAAAFGSEASSPET